MTNMISSEQWLNKTHLALGTSLGDEPLLLLSAKELDKKHYQHCALLLDCAEAKARMRRDDLVQAAANRLRLQLARESRCMIDASFVADDKCIDDVVKKIEAQDLGSPWLTSWRPFATLGITVLAGAAILYFLKMSPSKALRRD